MQLVGLSHIFTISFAISATAAAQTPPTVASTPRLTVDAAIGEALEKNLELIAARAGVSMADANVITAGLRPNPVLSVGGDHLDWLGTGFDDKNGAGPPEYSARIDFLLERGAKRARRIELAQHDGAIAEAEVLDRVRALKLEVQQAFVDLQLGQEQVAVAPENAGNLQEILALAEARTAVLPSVYYVTAGARYRATKVAELFDERNQH